MSKVIEFPSKDKRIEKFLREQLPLELPPGEIEELAAELREAAEKVDTRKAFQLLFPQTCTQTEMEFITGQVEGIIRELMDTIREEEGEIFSLIVRYHLLLHEARQLIDGD